MTIWEFYTSTCSIDIGWMHWSLLLLLHSCWRNLFRSGNWRIAVAESGVCEFQATVHVDANMLLKTVDTHYSCVVETWKFTNVMYAFATRNNWRVIIWLSYGLCRLFQLYCSELYLGMVAESILLSHMVHAMQSVKPSSTLLHVWPTTTKLWHILVPLHKDMHYTRQLLFFCYNSRTPLHLPYINGKNESEEILK